MSKIKTGFSANDAKAKEILQSVIGQLSDGIWENSPGMEKYWKTLDVKVDGDDIVIDTVDGWGSPFYKYAEDERERKVLDFFANKVKQIIKKEIEDGYTQDSRNHKMEWKRDCDAISEYMGYKETITVKDCYRVYDKLKGRKDRIPENKKIRTHSHRRLTESVDYDNLGELGAEVRYDINELVRSSAELRAALSELLNNMSKIDDPDMDIIENTLLQLGSLNSIMGPIEKQLIVLDIKYLTPVLKRQHLRQNFGR